MLLDREMPVPPGSRSWCLLLTVLFAASASCASDGVGTHQLPPDLEDALAISGMEVIIASPSPPDDSSATDLTLSIIRFGECPAPDLVCAESRIRAEPWASRISFTSSLDVLLFSFESATGVSCAFAMSEVEGSGRMRDEVEDMLPDNRSGLWRTTIECP